MLAVGMDGGCSDIFVFPILFFLPLSDRKLDIDQNTVLKSLLDFHQPINLNTDGVILQAKENSKENCVMPVWVCHETWLNHKT